MNFMFQKTFFSNKISFLILENLKMINFFFYFLAKINFYFLIISMLFYLFHDSNINSFDLFLDYWIKYQFIIIDNFSFDIISYFILSFTSMILDWRIYDKYQSFYFDDE